MMQHFDREKLIWKAALSSNEKFILLALNSFVGADGHCWPGQATLASMTGLTIRTVRNLCKSLEEKRIIQRTKRRKDGHQTSDDYFVNFTVLAKHSQPERDSASQPENDDTSRKEIPPASRKMTTFQPETVSADLSRELTSIELPSSLEREREEKQVIQASLDKQPQETPAAQQGNEQGSTSLAYTLPGARSYADPLRARFAPKPWRDAAGKISQAFCDYVGKQLPSDGQMHPRAKGRNHIINLERQGELEKLEGYWSDWNGDEPEVAATDRPTVNAEIRKLLDALGLTGLLPQIWQERTGVQMVSELADEQAILYRDMLKARRQEVAA